MEENSKYNARELSYQVLYRVLYDGKLLDAALIDAISGIGISDIDMSYIKRECTGVIERLEILDSYIKRYTLFNIKKISKEVMCILRIGIYEILYMDRVPTYATINECVNLTKRHSSSRHYNSEYKYVNALLRKVDREHIKDGNDDSLAENKHCYFRVYNDNERAVLDELSDKKIKYKLYDGALDFKYSRVYSIGSYKEILNLENFKSGNILIADASSIYLTDRLAYYIKEKKIDATGSGNTSVMKLLDTCAAPGGKILNLLDIIASDYCNIFAEARDISEEKNIKIRDNVNRLKVHGLDVKVKDASVYDEVDKDKFDVVISDVPCSGLGVVGKKPDVKYHFSVDKLKSLISLQKSILSVSSKYVKKGGILSYSTCTTTKEENEEVIEDFLSHNIDYNKLYEKRIDVNDENKADGFYMCFMEKI